MIDIPLEAQRFILVFFRVLSLIWFLPLFESTAVSAIYKAGLGMLIAFLLFQTVPFTADLHGDAFLLLIAVGKEVLIGLAMGFFVRILFMAVSSAGEVMSMQSGLSFARALDPMLAAQTSVLEQFQSLLATMVFLGIDGHHVVLQAIAKSLRDVPPGQVMLRPALFNFLATSTGKIFGASLKICAPVVATLFLMEVALGILARLVPQVNVFIEGASIKVLVTMGMMAFALNLIVPVIASFFRGLDSNMLIIIRAVR